MKNIIKVIFIIFLSTFFITCTKNERVFYFKSNDFKNLNGYWEIQSIFSKGIDSTKYIMADTLIADGWSFNFNYLNKNNEENYFSCNRKRNRITKHCTDCWYLAENNKKLIITFNLIKNDYEKLWQKNNKEVIFNIDFLNDYYMILHFDNYQLNFIKRYEYF
ncbi:MAG: hypothetical protein ACK4IK_10230 [Bacteroidia bacterium]